MPGSAPEQPRARSMERHLRGRRLPVQRALTAAPQQRWPTLRSGSAFRQPRCHTAAPEYRRLRAEPGPPAPRWHGSGSAPAPRIRLRAEPARSLPRQHVSCSVPAAVMRPRCLHPSVAARARRRAGRAGPPPRAPGVPQVAPRHARVEVRHADPSAGAVPVRTPGRCSPSMYSSRAPLCAGCRAVAPPRERRRPAGRRPGGCSCRRPARSTRAGVAGAAAGLTTGRATAPQTDHPGTIPAPAKRHAATPLEPRPARAPTPTPTPGDASAAEVVEHGLRPRTARRVRQRQRERRRAPETASRARSTPAAAAAAPACPAPRSYATARLATGTTGVFTAAASPEYCSARGARPGADWDAALPVAAVTSRRPAGCAPAGAEQAPNADGSSENRLHRPRPVRRLSSSFTRSAIRWPAAIARFSGAPRATSGGKKVRQPLRPIFCNRSLRARHQSADRPGLRCRQAGQGEAAEHRQRRWAQGPLAGA